MTSGIFSLLAPRLEAQVVAFEPDTESAARLRMVRFHIPLIEPDRRISRIRLSEKTHAFAHGKLRVRHVDRNHLGQRVRIVDVAVCSESSTAIT